MIHGPSLLFCPGDRPERYRKAADMADSVILDLEDAVAPADKAGARRAFVENPLDPDRTIVRINPAGSPDQEQDLAALADTPYRTVILAKAEDPRQLDALAGYRVIALCETARGVAHAGTIAAHSATVALMWGAEDLLASLGGRSSRAADGTYRDVARTARANVLLAAGAAGVAAIDGVHLDIPDLNGLRAEAEDAATSGFSATACIHPSQVRAIREAYAPTPKQMEWARAVLAEAGQQGGVFRFRGQMIDEPVLRQARAYLS
ncbi:HpcH/HpaI aldolase/citrate lyase family protein [Microbacterium sp. RD1]|uniref:HpcH/HpaI aldolase/citrate lyase family protein n=1 Tax=Microbacterium sp. RD1 TaxID=3457313 RepID=UPI003FA55ED2